MLNDFLYSTLTSIHFSQRSTMSNKMPLISSPYVICNKTKVIENQHNKQMKKTVDYKTDVAGRCCGNVVSICDLGSTYIIYKIVVNDHHDFTTSFLCKRSGGSRQTGCILISRTIYWYLLHSRILWGGCISHFNNWSILSFHNHILHRNDLISITYTEMKFESVKNKCTRALDPVSLFFL